MLKNRALYLGVRAAAFMMLPLVGMIVLELAIQERKLSEVSDIGYSAIIVDYSVPYLAIKAVLGALPVFALLLSVWLHAVADRLQVNLGTDNRNQSRLLHSILNSEEPFVLLIRSFRHDSSTLFSGYNESMTFEKVLIAHLDHVGRFVAVGRPGEALPPAGAIRLYFPDHEWRDRIRQLMARASLVAIIMGDTQALLWEVEQGLTTLTPEKLLLFLRLSQKSDAGTLNKDVRAVSSVLEQIRGHTLRAPTENDVFVWFDQYWRPNIESSSVKKHVFDRIKMALNALPDERRSLRSTLSKPGFRWKYGHFKANLIALALFFFLVMLRVSYEVWRI